MKCNKIERFLPAFLVGGLSGERRDAVARHLRDCAECRQELAALRADESVLRSVETPESPAWLATRVMAEVRDSGMVRSAPKPVWARLLPIAAAVLLVAGGTWAGIRLGTELARGGQTQTEYLDGSDLAFSELVESTLAGE